MAKRKPVSNRVILTAEEFKAEVRNGWSEAQFTKEVLSLAKRCGWRTAHFRPGMTAKGQWVTAVAGDGKGFPDLILIRGHKMIAAELKVKKNVVEPDQQDWLDAFDDLCSAAVEARIWRPSDWPEIERILT